MRTDDAGCGLKAPAIYPGRPAKRRRAAGKSDAAGAEKNHRRKPGRSECAAPTEFLRRPGA